MNQKAFFDACRKGVMGPTLDGDEVSGAGAIIDAMAGAPLADTAYALATAWHETAHTMQPIREFGGTAYLRRMYDVEGQNPARARKMGNVTPGDGPRYAVVLTKPEYEAFVANTLRLERVRRWGDGLIMEKLALPEAEFGRLPEGEQ